MHELAIVEALIGEVCKQLEMAGCQGRVVKLRLQIGRFSGVSLEALRFAFEVSKPGTVVAEAQLDIEQTGAWCLCRACGQRTPVEELLGVCPVCGSAEIQLEGGQELLLERIEIEEPSDRPDQE